VSFEGKVIDSPGGCERLLRGLETHKSPGLSAEKINNTMRVWDLTDYLLAPPQSPHCVGVVQGILWRLGGVFRGRMCVLTGAWFHMVMYIHMKRVSKTLTAVKCVLWISKSFVNMSVCAHACKPIRKLIFFKHI